MLKPGMFYGPGTFRAILALAVVVSHMSSIKLGRPAVFVFFALSGYWVMRMWAEKYRHGPVLSFYTSRALRIWPAFATAFLLAFAALNIFGQPRSVMELRGLILVGIATTERDVLGTSWSLDLEMQFYAAVPLLYWLGCRLFARSFARALLATAALTAIGWLIAWNSGIRLFLCYLPCFLAGCAIWALDLRVSRGLALASLGLFLTMAAVFALLPLTRVLVLRQDVSTSWEDGFGMAWTTFLIPFVAWNVRQTSSWIDTHLGNFSYSLYITHFPVILIAGGWLRPFSVADRVVILAAVLLVAATFYLIVDRYWESLRQRFMRRTMPAGSKPLP